MTRIPARDRLLPFMLAVLAGSLTGVVGVVGAAAAIAACGTGGTAHTAAHAWAPVAAVPDMEKAFDPQYRVVCYRRSASRSTTLACVHVPLDYLPDDAVPTVTP